MATLTIKGLPDDLYERLRESAAGHRRSINREAIVRLEESLRARRVDREAVLARIEARHARLRLPPLTDEFLRKARNEGRP